jgi:glutathione S-transferase
MDKLQLYQFAPLGTQESASPFCVKVRNAMRYKRLPFETINATSPIQIRKLNSRGKLPMLVDDGMNFIDSTIIVQHLEAHHPEPRLYPADARTRAMALLIEDWADEALYWHVVYERWQVRDQFAKFGEAVFSPVPAALRPMLKLIICRQVRRHLRGQGLGRMQVNEQREKFRAALDWLESTINGHFLTGAEVSIADIATAAQIEALNMPFTPVAQAEIHAHAKIMQWLERTFDAIG